MSFTVSSTRFETSSSFGFVFQIPSMRVEMDCSSFCHRNAGDLVPVWAMSSGILQSHDEERSEKTTTRARFINGLPDLTDELGHILVAGDASRRVLKSRSSPYVFCSSYWVRIVITRWDSRPSAHCRLVSSSHIWKNLPS